MSFKHYFSRNAPFSHIINNVKENKATLIGLSYAQFFILTRLTVLRLRKHQSTDVDDFFHFYTCFPLFPDWHYLKNSVQHHQHYGESNKINYKTNFNQ
jgi:hypothetical protein